MQNLLDDCIKTIIQLVSIRRDTSRFSKIPQESKEISFLNQIPIFDKSQFNQFSNDIKERPKMVSTIRKINYQFDKSIINYYIESKDPPSEISLVIIFYQVIARMFTEPLTSDDYILIMKVLEKPAFINNSINSDFINYSFYLLVETAHQTKHFKWTKEIIIKTAKFFQANMTLKPNFYALLIQFLTIVFKLEPEDKEGLIKMIFGIIYGLFNNSKSKLLAQKDFTSLLDIINSYLNNLNYDAVLLLATISKYDNSKVLQSYTRQLPILFVTKIQEKSIQDDMKISIRDTKQIHNYPSVYQSRVPRFDFKFIPTTDSKRITNVPYSLLPIHAKKIVSLISSGSKEITSLFIDFFRKANSDLIKPFFTKLNDELCRCFQSSDGYTILVPYLFLLDSIGLKVQSGIINEDKISENMMRFLREPIINRRTMSDTVTNRQKSQKIDIQKFDYNILFDPSKTVFGPFMLDQTLNVFRAKFVDIVFTKCKNLILPLLKSADGYPFLMAEIVGRYYCYSEILIPYLCSDDQMMNECFKYVSKHAMILQTIGSQKGPRDIIFIFMGEFLRNKASFEKCLKSTVYLDSFYHFMYDQRYTKSVLTLIYQAMLVVKTPNIVENTAIYLFKSSKNENLSNWIFQTVSAAVCHNTILIPVFKSFISPVIANLKKDPTSKLSFDIAIQIVAQYANQKDHFILKSDDFQVLASSINFASYTLLFNLIMGTHSISIEALFTIKKPAFLPLLLIAHSNNNFFQNKDNSGLITALTDLSRLATYSEYNARALHDGDIDYILLNHLHNNPLPEATANPIQYKGFEFTLQLSKEERKMLVYPLIKLITSKKSDEKVAHLMMKTIIEAHDTEILSILSYNINENRRVPSPNFPIGTIPHFCEATGFNGSQFNGILTFVFWLKMDPMFLQRPTAEINLFSVSDANNSHNYSIVIIGGSLYASFNESKVRTLVCISPRLDYNKWSHFVIEFTNTDEDGRIYFKTYQNYDRLQDSEFNLVHFNSTPVILRLGGYISTSESLYNPNCVFGSIAKFAIFTRLIDDQEIVKLILNEHDQPTDYLFSMDDYRHDMFSTTLTKTMNINGTQSLIEQRYFPNYIKIDTLEERVSSHEIAEKLVKSIPLIPRSMLFNYLNLLGQIISKTNNKQLSAICASYLINIDQGLDYSLFATVYSIVKSIVSKTIQRYWVEDVIANCTLWSKSGSHFHRILFEYGTKLITDFQSTIWSKKSYFSYFLNQFNEHCCIKENKSDIPMFSLFLERLSLVTIEVKDIRYLVSFLINSSDSNKVVYLQMISKMSQSIKDDQYTLFSTFLSVLDTENIEIAENVLITMSEIYRDYDFHRYIIVILNFLAVDKKLLFEALNKKETLDLYPNVFPLLCSIALEINQNIKYIPKGVVRSSFWYLFPLLLSLRFDDNIELIDFVAINALDSNDIDEIISITIYLTSYANYKCQHPTSQLLRAMMEFSKDCKNQDSLFKIFFHSLETFFFHFDAPFCHKIFLNFPDYKSKSEMNDDMKKVSDKFDISNVEGLRRFIQTDFTKKRMRFYLSYNEDKYINWPLEKPMKKKLTDYSLLSEASAIADHIIDYPIPNVAMIDDGTFLKWKKKPQFNISDVKHLIDSILQMELKSDNLQEFENRNNIMKYLIKRMHATITTQSVMKIKNLFLKANARQFSTNFSKELASIEKVRISSMLSKPNFRARMTRNYNICFAFCPFLLKTVNANVEIHRFNPKKVDIFENSKIITLMKQIPARVTVETIEISNVDEHKSSNNNQQTSSTNNPQSLSTDNKVGSPIRASFSTTDFEVADSELSIEASEEYFNVKHDSEIKVLKTKKIIKIKTKISTNELDIMSDVLNIFYMNRNSILIVTVSHEPFLIDFSPASCDEFIQMIQPVDRYFRSSIDVLVTLIPLLQKKWAEHNISNFKYLNFLNLISGRNYENPEAYPLFPSPNFLDKSLPPTLLTRIRRSSEGPLRNSIASKNSPFPENAEFSKAKVDSKPQNVQQAKSKPKPRIIPNGKPPAEAQQANKDEAQGSKQQISKDEAQASNKVEENANKDEGQDEKQSSKVEAQSSKDEQKASETQVSKDELQAGETQVNKDESKDELQAGETQVNKDESKDEQKASETQVSKDESKDELQASEAQVSKDESKGEMGNKHSSVQSLDGEGIEKSDASSLESIVSEISSEKRLSIDSSSLLSDQLLPVSPTKSTPQRSPSKGSLAAQFPSIASFLQRSNFGNNWLTDPGIYSCSSKRSANSSAFFDDKSRFVLPELYFMYDSIDENVYEYRKKLESSSNINKWVSIIFGRDRRIITEKLHRRLFSTPIPDRPSRPIIDHNLQSQIDIINDTVEGSIVINDSSDFIRNSVDNNNNNNNNNSNNNNSNNNSKAGSNHLVGSLLKNIRGRRDSNADESSLPRRLSYLSIPQVVYASSAYYENGFIVVLETGEIKMLQVVYNREMRKMCLKSTSLRERIENPRDPRKHYFYFNTGVVLGLTASVTDSITFGLIVYDEGKNTLDLITNRRIVRYEKIFIENPIFNGSVYFRTPSTIDFISRFLKDHESGEVNDDIVSYFPSQKVAAPPYLYTVKCNVNCFVCSEIFPIFVIGGDDGKIRIRSLTEGKKINTVDLGNEIPMKIIITDCWGFILVKTINKLFLLSTNGRILKTIDNFINFSQWFSFHTHDDFDYVVLKDEENRIIYFEAMYPENLKVFIDFSASINVIKYDPYQSCFLLLTTDCRLFCFPCDVAAVNDSANNSSESVTPIH